MIADLEGTYDEAGLPGSDIPDGRYQVKILSGELNYAASGRPQCSWQLQIANGEFVNRRLFKHDGLDNEQSSGFFKLGLQRLGVETKTMRELPDELAKLIDTYAEVRVKNTNEFCNSHFVKALDDDEVETADLEDLDASKNEKTSSEEEEEDWKVGNACEVEYDGKPCSGIITKIGDETATVDFEDDDTTDEVNFDDLQVPESEEKTSNGDEAGTEVQVTFNDEQISKAQIKTLETLAKEHEFDPDNYEEWADLLADIGEYVGVSGTFKTAADLLGAIKKV